jgi:diguanylate cyclase (GGDEF)-like protein
MSASSEITEIPFGRVQRRLFSIYARSGTWGVVRTITAISVMTSVVLTVVSAGLTAGQDGLRLLLPIAVVVPLIVAPAASYLVADLMSSLAEAYERVRVVSLVDSLTGVLNRRGFFETSEARFATWPEQHAPVAAMVDLDRFKAANDRHGHVFGDRILAALGRRLRELVGGSGVVGRVGGDEFALVVDSRQVEAGELEHRLSQACRAIDATDTMVVEASFGVVRAQRGDSIDAMLCRADRALYAEKRSKMVDDAI